MKSRYQTAAALIILLLVLFMSLSGSVAYAADPEVAYSVTIKNLTVGQPFSPLVAATHAGTTRIFRVGSVASAELTALAEDGNQALLVNALNGAANVTAVVDGGDPLAPGASATFEIKGKAGDRFSLAAMLACTNDGFTGLNRVPLPAKGSRVYQLTAYDAGTENNTEQSEDIVDPCSTLGPVVLAGDPNGNVNDAVNTDPAQPIQTHPGVLVVGDLLAAHGWTDPVAEVTITKLTDTSKLRTAVTVAGVRRHQARLQEIANGNDDTRVAGSSGHDKSAEYVFNRLKAAGYNVEYQEFEFPFFQELAEPVFEQVSPNPATYTPNDLAGFGTMQYSGSGDVTAAVQSVIDIVIPPGPTPSTSNSGCEGAFIEDDLGNIIPNPGPDNDFAGFVVGNIALIQRGTCTFGLKAINAEAAGAVAVVIFNEGQPGRTDAIIGTLGGPVVTIPVIGTTFAIGEELYNLSQAGEVTVHISTSTVSETRTTRNVLADTRDGRGDHLIVVGAHLDSVAEGSGINDNGSGSAADLEVALQLARLGIKPLNKIRFAFWSAEESGLIGSQFYVDNLSDEQFSKHLLNLNFDMVGSPNFVRFVYDGDGSDTPDPGPPGSENIEKVFNDYFASQGLATSPTAFDGRSDYGPFILVGIPAGGLFTGAEGIKTDEEAAIYGGTAGEAYDPCYHQACDRFNNNSNQAIREMSDAIAHAILTFAMSDLPVSDTVGTSRTSASSMEYQGSRLQK